MLPELLERGDKSVLQLVECGANASGEVFANMPEDLLGGVQCGARGLQIKGMHVLWPAHLTTAMTARTVQDNPNWPLSQLVVQMVQEDLQAVAFHGWQEEKDASTRGGFDSGIQPQPLVLVLHDPRGDVAPSEQTKSAFIVVCTA